MSDFNEEISRPLSSHIHDDYDDDKTAAVMDNRSESYDLDRYAMHENTAPLSATAVSMPSGGNGEDDGLLLNFGHQSTARPLVTPPPAVAPEKETTMIHLTPDDLSSSVRGEPFVNVTKGGSSYGDDDVDDDGDNVADDVQDELTNFSRPSAPPDSPTSAANLLRHPNPYRYTEEDEEDDNGDLDQFDPLKENDEDDNIRKPQEQHHKQEDKDNDDEYIKPQSASAAVHQQYDLNLEEMADEYHHDQQQHDQIEEVDQYLNGDFVAPPIEHRSAPEPDADVSEKRNVDASASVACGSCTSCPLNTLGAWFKADNLDPRVADLIYWRDVKTSGATFGTGLVLLLSLAYFSLISVVAHLLLGVMIGTLSYRIYKTVLQAVQKSNDGHPFKAYLDIDLNLPSEKVHEISEVAVKHIECALKELRRLFLVEDLVDSIKFALLMWCFTYIGAWFNGLTLFILAFVSLFTLPKVYETHKTEIDRYIAIATVQIQGVINKAKAKIPIGKKQKEQ